MSGPVYISDNLAPLYDLRAWVTYRNRIRPGSTKPDWIPLDPATGEAHDCNDETIWQSLDNCVYAVKHYPNIHDGVGFVFSPRTLPVVGIAIERYKLSPQEPAMQSVRDILALLQTYIELSPSGQGRHALGYLTDPAVIRRLGSSRQGLLDCIEIFATTRYFTMTFNAWRDLPLVDISGVVNLMLDEHERLIGHLAPASVLCDDGVIEPMAIPSPPDDRELQIVLAEVIERLRALRPWDHEDLSRDLYIPLGIELDPDMLAKYEGARRYLFACTGNDHNEMDAVVARNVSNFTNRFDVYEQIMKRTGLFRTVGKAPGYLADTFVEAQRHLQHKQTE